MNVFGVKKPKEKTTVSDRLDLLLMLIIGKKVTGRRKNKELKETQKVTSQVVHDVV